MRCSHEKGIHCNFTKVFIRPSVANVLLLDLVSSARYLDTFEIWATSRFHKQLTIVFQNPKFDLFDWCAVHMLSNMREIVLDA